MALRGAQSARVSSSSVDELLVCVVVVDMCELPKSEVVPLGISSFS
jgi:hypothetical protein